MWNKTKDAGGKTAAENRDILLREINDLLLSGDPKLVDEFIKGKSTGRMVSKWGKMDEKGWTALTRKLINLGAKDDDIMQLKVGLGQIRQRWDDLFSAIGRTLEPEELRAFKNEFGNKFKRLFRSDL